MKILITGINGFLGRNLINCLNKFELFGLGSKESINNGIHVFQSSNLETIDLDIDIVIICHAAVASGDIILSNESLYNVNVALTERVVNKFKNSFIIYISSVSVYEVNSLPIIEKSRINPQSNYAISKLWGEKIVSSAKKFSILRVSSIYGIEMKENTLIPNYVNQALKDKEIKVWGRGERLQNYVYVGDIVKYIDLIIQEEEKVRNKVLLGVGKKNYSNLEIAKIISNITKAKISFVNEDNSKSFCYNNDYTVGLLDWKSESNIESELETYIEWKRKKY